jgi:hypothetical protein
LQPFCAALGDCVKKGSIPAFILFLYDCVRLGFILALAKDQASIPLLSANMLFPIAGFFLYAGQERYREYVPLYIAGKAIGVFAGLVWLFFALKNGLRFTFSPIVRFDYMLFFLFVLVFADMLSLFARLLIHQPHKRTSRQNEPFQSAGEIAKCE